MFPALFRIFARGGTTNRFPEEIKKPKNVLSTMKKTLCTIALLLAAIPFVGARESDAPVQKPKMSLRIFQDAVNHWRMTHKEDYPRYAPEQYREIADNLLAYQNADGGWPKNIDWMAVLDADSVRMTLSRRSLSSTLDNSNIYPQMTYLSEVYGLTGDERYRQGAERAVEYILGLQHPVSGGWRGADVDAVTYNDGVMSGILSTWLEILRGNEIYGWMDDSLRERIRQSWERGLAVILATQYVQNGVKTVWCQQHDHETLEPCKARSYELPSLSAGESAGIVLLLMSIDHPSPEVVEAVEGAVAWFERTKIEGKRIVTIPMPEGNPEDPSIKKDRRLVDDPAAKGLWPRFSELEDNTPFFCNRDGIKVYTLEEVLPERRTGYGWYGEWGQPVLKAYPKWKQRIGKE